MIRGKKRAQKWKYFYKYICVLKACEGMQVESEENTEKFLFV